MAVIDSIELNRGVLLPQLPELPTPYLPRQRLHDLLDETVARFAVTGLVAPAAFGKTTLLVGWRRVGSAPPMAYLALDALDNDPKWFWSRLVAAIDGLGRDGAGTERAVLVFDDLEALDNPAVVEILDTFLFDLPRGLRVVLSSRSEPNFRRGLLRARGQLVDIPTSELAFDTTEVAALLTKFDRRVSTDDTAAIAAQSEGWVGALKLAALTPRNEGTTRELAHRVKGSNPYVADLLNTEILARQTSEVRDFLLRTSVLDDLDAQLCDAVTGQRASAGTLEQLLQRGLVVRVGEGETKRYRHRRLFRDFLRHHLETVDPERMCLAHAAAARWFEARGDLTAAVHHLLAGDDTVTAVELMLEHGERAAAEGRLETVRAWLEALPTETLTRDPRLLAGVSRLCVKLGLRDEALIWLDRARWRLDEDRDRGAATEIALLTSYTRGQAGYLRAAIDDANRALRLATHAADPQPTTIAKVHHLLASIYTGLDEFDHALQHQQAAPNNGDDEFPPTAYSAWLSQRAGQLGRAIELSDAHLARSPSPWHEPIAFAARGAARRERNQPREAEADLQAAIDLGITWSRPLTTGFCMVELALLRHGEGRLAEAHEILAAARGQADGTDLRDRVDITEALLWLREGDVERSPLDWLAEDVLRMVYFATALGRTGDLALTDAWLSRAETALAAAPEGDAREGPRAVVDAARALWLAALGHIEAVVEIAHRVDGRLAADPKLAGLRQSLAMVSINGHLTLDAIPEAERLCDALDSPASSELIRGVAVPGYRARLALRQGRLHLAEEAGRQSLRMGDTLGVSDHPLLRNALLAVAGVRLERGDVAEVEEMVHTARGLVAVRGWRGLAAQVHIELASVRGAIHGPAAGLLALDECRRDVEADSAAGPELLWSLDATEARLHLDAGDPASAEALIVKLPPGNATRLLRVRLALAQCEGRAAADLLADVDEPRQLRDHIVRELLAARVAALLGQPDSDRHLVAAASAAVDEGFCRIFHAEAPELLPELRRLARPGSSIDRLVASLDTLTLSDREMAVLLRLQGSLTNQEIAGELGVSANTVKTHIRTLYRKLGVRSRADAVAAARRRQLL